MLNVTVVIVLNTGPPIQQFFICFVQNVSIRVRITELKAFLKLLLSLKMIIRNVLISKWSSFISSTIIAKALNFNQAQNNTSYNSCKQFFNELHFIWNVKVQLLRVILIWLHYRLLDITLPFLDLVTLKRNLNSEF